MIRMMSERILHIRMYRILRKLGVPRDEITLDADFEQDYLLSAGEKNLLLNWIEFRYEIEFSKNEENQFHNTFQLMQIIR